MKQQFCAGLAACGLVFSMITPALAQDLPPDFGGSDFDGTGSFEIETDSGAGEGVGWSRYIGGSVGAVTADGDTVSRQLAAIRLDINLPATDRLKTVLSIDAVDFENSYTQELKERYQDDHRNCVSEFRNGRADEVEDPNFPVGHNFTDEDIRRNRQFARWEPCETLLNDTGDGYIRLEQGTDVADSFADFREAYVQWEPTDFATVAIGRQNLVWGQFDFLSPVGFLLPFRTTNTSTRPSRADFSFAQDAAALSLFPTSNSEVKLIHVPQMRVDPSVEENLKSYARNNYCERDTQGNFTADCAVDDDKNFFPDAADYEMSALRFTHYGERLTVSVTALDGVLMNFGDLYRDATLVGDGVNGTDCGTYCWRDDKGLVYGELETLALEFAYILNPRVTIKGEFVTFERIDGVNLRDDDLDDRDANLAHAIVERNQGRPYIKNDEIFLALGFEYEGDEWFGHLQLVVIDSQPSSKVDEVLKCIEDDGEYDRNNISCGNPQFDDDDDDVFPVFFIGRRLGVDDEGFVGGGATAFFNAYGFGIFGGWQLNEDIEIGGFFGSVVDVTDSGPQDNPYYDTVDDGDTLVQIGVTYLF